MSTKVAITQAVVRRDGSIKRPLWEQTHFVLSVRQVFLASRDPDEATFWRTIGQAVDHVRLEGRARWAAVVGVDEHRGISGIATADVALGALIGRSLDVLSLPEEVTTGARAVHQYAARDLVGPLALLGSPSDDVAVLALHGGGRLLGVALAGVRAGARDASTWLEVFGDLLAWTMKGRLSGGARPGMGLPTLTDVAEQAPDALWMAHALELAGEPLAVSPFPGVMSFVNSAAKRFMASGGVEDYAVDIEPPSVDDADDLAWRAQTMIAVVADPVGAGRQVVREVPDGNGGTVFVRFEARLVRDPDRACIERAVMTIHRVNPEELARVSSEPADHGDPTPAIETDQDEREDAGTQFQLTLRQRQVARRLARGDRPAMIAADLGLSIFTVRGHISSLYRITGATDLPDLLAQTRHLLN